MTIAVIVSALCIYLVIRNVRAIREERHQSFRLERVEVEQERITERLEDHERRISDLEFKMRQADADIEHWNSVVNQLYALLDIAQDAQHEAIRGGKQDIKYQKQIITLNNQIHNAEARLAKAKHVKETSARELKEA